MLAGSAFDDPEGLVRANQAMATILVITGVAAIAYGLRALSGVAVAVFLGILLPSASVIYVAHHALAENLALALVGLGVACLFRRAASSRWGVDRHSRVGAP